MDPYGEGVLAAIAGVGNKELPNDSFVRMMEAKGMNATGGVRSDKPMQEGSDEQRCAAYLGCLKAISAIDRIRPNTNMPIWSCAAPATASTLSSDMETSATTIDLMALRKVFPCTAASASAASDSG